MIAQYIPFVNKKTQDMFQFYILSGWWGETETEKDSVNLFPVEPTE